jgi:uncharacterized RDD family membrane protein YckC
MPLKRQSPAWASAPPPQPPPQPPAPEEQLPIHPADVEEPMAPPEGVQYFDPPPAERAYSTYSPPPYPAPSQQPATPAMMGYAPERSISYAGFWLRFVAYIIDSIVMMIGAGCVGAIIGGVIGVTFAAAGFSQNDLEMIAELAGYVIGVVVGWLYYAMMESSTYQATLGKMALSLRVTDTEGRRISFARATGRHFAKILSAILLLIGYIMAGFTEKKQALHDMIADCLVLRVA